MLILSVKGNIKSKGKVIIKHFKVRMSENYCFCNSWKSNTFRKEKLSKETTPQMRQSSFKEITLQDDLEKSPILLSQHLKEY